MSQPEPKQPRGSASLPERATPTCDKCGGAMRYNVPRLGSDGGYVHALTRRLACPGELDPEPTFQTFTQQPSSLTRATEGWSLETAAQLLDALNVVPLTDPKPDQQKLQRVADRIAKHLAALVHYERLRADRAESELAAAKADNAALVKAIGAAQINRIDLERELDATKQMLADLRNETEQREKDGDYNFVTETKRLSDLLAAAEDRARTDKLRAELRAREAGERAKLLEAYALAAHWWIDASNEELAKHNDTREAAWSRLLDAELAIIKDGRISFNAAPKPDDGTGDGT